MHYYSLYFKHYNTLFHRGWGDGLGLQEITGGNIEELVLEKPFRGFLSPKNNKSIAQGLA